MMRFICILSAVVVSFTVSAGSPFQRSVDSIPAVEGVGKLVIPAGVHVTGSLQLKSGLN